MFCPLTFNQSDEVLTRYKNSQDCIGENCAWWDSKANFNPETKQFEGQCCILTLSRLKITGGINTHAY
jgi:hypothetical protein